MMHTSQILINQMSFVLPKTILFDDLTIAICKTKTGIVGKNGIGKSTLLRLIMGELNPSSGFIQIAGKLAYVPQKMTEQSHLMQEKTLEFLRMEELLNQAFFITSEMTVAGFLDCDKKIGALQRILAGSIECEDFIILNDDWDVIDRMQQQLSSFGLNISFDRLVNTLSGGEITRLCLIKAFNSNADFILLDEPTNHLDKVGRMQLYKAIEHWQGGLIVVSHDRALLNVMENIVELNTLGVKTYGGNFSFYQRQKEMDSLAAEQQLLDAKKSFKKINRSIQATKEKHEQRQSKGTTLRRSGSQAKIILNMMKNRSTESLGKMATRHQRMVEQAKEQLLIAKEKIEDVNKIHVELKKTIVPQGKIILNLENISFTYPNCKTPTIKNYDLILKGGTRIALRGDNGSGKTTLIKLILGELTPQVGKIYVGTDYVSYLDQSLNQLQPELSILDNFIKLNPEMNEYEARTCLASFLFKNNMTLELVKNLSGGEKLRAMLACILLSDTPPQLLILDEPTNYLDLDSIQAIESALVNYQGAMIVVSHDEAFLENIKAF